MSAGTASGDAGARLRQLAALEKRGLPPDGGERFNRLIFAASPYLLQHAENPVDWFPWGDEAFGKAAAEDKPVFLSIGYATCHWCHVMAYESFGDRDVADVLNRYFVAIKVDREERPDIDDRYMTVSRLMTGGGGYNVENTVRAWALAWTVLSGQDLGIGMEAAMGGVMLQSTDWQGGLRDRELPVTNQQREMVLPALETSIETLKAGVFPIHGL